MHERCRSFSNQHRAHTADTPQLLLDHHLKELRLPTILREYDKVARQCAVEQVDYQHYLLRITEEGRFRYAPAALLP